MLAISQLFIYPIKSLGGISVSSAWVTDRGFQYDRRWMLVNEQNRFLSQREYPKMALLTVHLDKGGLRIKSEEHKESGLFIPFDKTEKGLENVTIWNATCEAFRVGKEVDSWFMDMLEVKCKLVYMPDASLRPVNTASGFSPKEKFTSFADAYPFLMLGEASMHDLNGRLPIPVSIKRFRPNIVFSGGFPYQEDEIGDFSIRQINFTGLENCARCMVPNIDPEKGILDKNKEPIKTLSTYRLKDNKIILGRNVVHTGTGSISVGDEIRLL
jgi:uncharacterized protein